MRVVQAGRVELDEFHIRSAAAGAPGGCNAVAGGGVGVGGVEVNLARAASGQNRLRGAEGDDVAGTFVQCVETQAALVRLACCVFGAGDQVHQRMLLKQCDVGRMPDLIDQRALHGGPCGIGHVHDAAGAVAALAGQVQYAVFL